MMKRICVIGAGSAGLTAAKHLLEEGFEVDILEKRDGVGGLWYFDQKEAGVASNTHATSSKTFLQFSDLPMEEETPYFPHHQEYLNYLKHYAEVNKVLPRIKFNCEVLRLRKQGEKWEIKVRQGEKTYTDIFDGVTICSGLHHVPLIPELTGHETFTGSQIHSSFLKNIEDLRGKRVVVVGGGESAADLVHELAPIADKVYLSLRKGMAVTRHVSPYGIPADYDSTRAKVWLPRQFLHDYNVDCRLQDRYCPFKTLYTLLGLPFFILMLPISFSKAMGAIRSLFDPKSWTVFFKPQPRHGPADGVELSQACQNLCQEKPQSQEELKEKAWCLKYIFDWYSGAMHNSQPFTKRQEFLDDIVKGDVTVVPGIKGYAGGSVVDFEGGTQVEADLVVMCTGFKSLLPFLEDQSLDGRMLYKNVFLPGEPTLAFVGFIRPNIGSAPAAAEMQSRWLASVFSGRLSLPSLDEMNKTVELDAQCYTQKRKIQATRLTSLVDYHGYMEEIAGFLGCRPNLWRLVGKPKMLWTFLFGPMASFQYRIHGYGANTEAAQAALDQLPDFPLDRVLQHTVLYLMKPWFSLFDKLGLPKFRPVF